MPESRVLIIDSDEGRGEQMAAVLHFIDCNPVVMSDAAEIDLKKQTPQDWVAVVIGQHSADKPWDKFIQWLGDDPLHPPLLLMPEHHGQGSQRFGINDDYCWDVDFPARYAQLSEVLRRASVKRLDEDYSREAAKTSGPTGNSAAVKRLRQMIEQVAGFDTTVLVLGESGTGKEVVARAIHERSERSKKPFVAINCGAIPADLLESELFGHEKGAFTGAITSRKGRFEMAQGGTLFLDEIGDMSLPMQVKLLRVLQERCYERVGSNQTIECDVRIIAATHRNLEQRITEDSFREDLFYRLNVFPIEMPGLRERLDDLPDLINDLVAALETQGRGSVRFSKDAITTLRDYAWPGNVRELANLVERVAVLHPGGVVRSADLPARYRANAGAAPAAEAPAEEAEPRAEAAAGAVLPAGGIDLKEHMAQIEISLIQQALDQTNGVVAHAAQLLGLRRTTLVEKLRKYQLEGSKAA